MNPQPSDNSPSTAAVTDLHPYARLTPDHVLDALASVQLYGDGRLMALSSYENRVYQVTLEDGQRVVAKFYRPGRWDAAQILEEHAFAAELMAAEVPAVGPMALNGATLHQHQDFAFSVSPWRGGRQPELDDPEVLQWIGRFLARIHTVGAAQPFVHRPRLDLQDFGVASRNWLLEQQVIPLDMQARWREQCDKAIELIADGACSTCAGGPSGLKDARLIRLHGDCHPGNILWTPLDEYGRGGPHFVDLDDARMGPAVQDLWMLLSGDRRQRTQQLGALLDGYEQLRSFDQRELALIEPLRTLRLIHYSAWLARRWQDPIFPLNFPWFGSSDYWRGQVDMLIEQIEAMQEAPLMV
ncbi:serine/threonine protein kinase [Verminephrobacter eiseniae]|uniref:Stress response kinase A n=1 Tax=Verminephrobacter eiseniae (strain EF01-2) TaxID=391735 RepID=A1WF61_VEREI|nr:serine/threonine protein kinase [Verminephrobacter eiseniae]ABM56268.1 aminoglycoside phosphotransferase [Verminephrobacter eiseniae EF01-2]MCW5286633.1 serine/threonine protein kinase [Verminephrobacter eiseniae]MCW5304931.1 serine/threonine protein kinase [Verminephrobacter eiseniae]MCW8178673.1 serine/threonine protein kinase [Verminephrobacter eiseniae]MCW8190710.1 serine/threonine protein kinase [Verminephrobacter eiseniae]